MHAEEAWRRTLERRHGVLATVHAQRGVDAVPVVYAPVGDGLAVPVDRVKAKRTTDLQRVRNLRADPRCVLLVEHYDDDWSRLWWVRVHAHAAVLEGPNAEAARAALAALFPAYRTPDAIAAVLLLRPTAVTGWQAHTSGGARGG